MSMYTRAQGNANFFVLNYLCLFFLSPLKKPSAYIDIFVSSLLISNSPLRTARNLLTKYN